MLAAWVEHSLEGHAMPRSGQVPGGRFILHAPGILELLPDRRVDTAHACVLSVGIHGNETAPIELLDGCLGRLAAGQLTPGAPVLAILGSLEAIRAGRRYLDTNLNRLFRHDLDETGWEPDRARELMTAVTAFFTRHADLPRLHYDLHTAIRSSRYPRFAVSPFAERTAVAAEQWRWLAAANIQAVLHQHRHSWTFSHYSKHYHAAQAFTLELGQVRPFGRNDLASLAPMGYLLEALLEGREPSGGSPSRMAFFRVEREVIRHTADFCFHFADDTPNFTEFVPGTLLAEDGRSGEVRVGAAPLSVVFPNARVELGARAALLARPAAAPS